MVQEIVSRLGSIASRIELLFHPNAVVLKRFPRIIQLDRFSCGPASVASILRYYGHVVPLHEVIRLLGTNSDGTDVSEIKRVLKSYGLCVKELRHVGIRELKEAIDSRSPALISTHDDEHYSVVYGYSRTHVFVINPSIGRMGSMGCAVPLKEFQKIWDRWGLVVTRIRDA
jgi:ABC-type bacteriocin/lantibiotic exporter with double-glycine peptidase domain